MKARGVSSTIPRLHINNSLSCGCYIDETCLLAKMESDADGCWVQERRAIWDVQTERQKDLCDAEMEWTEMVPRVRTLVCDAYGCHLDARHSSCDDALPLYLKRCDTRAVAHGCDTQRYISRPGDCAVCKVGGSRPNDRHSCILFALTVLLESSAQMLTCLVVSLREKPQKPLLRLRGSFLNECVWGTYEQI